MQVFDALPNVRYGIEVTLQLVSPTRTYGMHEIHHCWEVEVQDDYINVSAGGYFFRPSTGGDSFTSLSWCANPGFAAEYGDYLDSILGIVDDAQPYEQEVCSLDLSEPGFSLSVCVNGEELDAGCCNEEDDRLSNDAAAG